MGGHTQWHGGRSELGIVIGQEICNGAPEVRDVQSSACAADALAETIVESYHVFSLTSPHGDSHLGASLSLKGTRLTGDGPLGEGDYHAVFSRVDREVVGVQLLDRGHVHAFSQSRSVTEPCVGKDVPLLVTGRHLFRRDQVRVWSRRLISFFRRSDKDFLPGGQRICS